MTRHRLRSDGAPASALLCSPRLCSSSSSCSARPLALTSRTLPLLLLALALSLPSALAQTFAGCYQRPPALPPGITAVGAGDYLPCINACRAANARGCAFTYGLPLAGPAAGAVQCFTVASLPVTLQAAPGNNCQQQCDVAANSNCARTVGFLSVFQMPAAVVTTIPAAITAAVRASPKNTVASPSSNPVVSVLPASPPAITAPDTPRSNTVAIAVSVGVLGLAIAFVAVFAVFYVRRRGTNVSRFTVQRNQQAMITLFDTLSLRRPGNRSDSRMSNNTNNTAATNPYKPGSPRPMSPLARGEPSGILPHNSIPQNHHQNSQLRHSSSLPSVPQPVHGGIARFPNASDTSLQHSPVPYTPSEIMANPIPSPSILHSQVGTPVPMSPVILTPTNTGFPSSSGFYPNMSPQANMQMQTQFVPYSPNMAVSMQSLSPSQVSNPFTDPSSRGSSTVGSNVGSGNASNNANRGSVVGGIPPSQLTEEFRKKRASIALDVGKHR